jgi:hypothetical protein
MASFWIREHVHVCIANDVIWLDRKNGRYHRTAGSRTALLARLVHGWPRDESGTSAIQGEVPPTSEALQALASELVAKGLISAGIENGHRFRSAVLSPAEATMEEASAGAKAYRRDWQRILNACVMTRLALRVGKLHLALSGIEKKKIERTDSGRLDEEEVRRLVRIFRYLRLFFYTPRQRCLFDSLVLARFLAAYGIAPSLVIGISTGPFRAHSWVQFGDTVLIGELDYVRRFSPILVV